MGSSRPRAGTVRKIEAYLDSFPIGDCPRDKLITLGSFFGRDSSLNKRRTAFSIAVDDFATVRSGPGQYVDVAVTSNDSDPDGDVVRLNAGSITSDAGSAVYLSDTTIRYTPAASFSGNANVNYSIRDGRGGTAYATLHTVKPNHNPVAVDDQASTFIGVPVAINVVANDTDQDGDILLLMTCSPRSAHSQLRTLIMASPE